jgi:hypothetical protein
MDVTARPPQKRSILGLGSRLKRSLAIYRSWAMSVATRRMAGANGVFSSQTCSFCEAADAVGYRQPEDDHMDDKTLDEVVNGDGVCLVEGGER